MEKDVAVALGLSESVALPTLVVWVKLLEQVHEPMKCAHGECAGATGRIKDLHSADGRNYRRGFLGVKWVVEVLRLGVE